MKKILIVTPIPHDSTSFYRAFGVFQNLKKLIDIDVVNLFGNPSVTWTDLIQIDIAFMHRPFQPAQLSLAAYVKRLGKPLWVDFDDDLFHVPDHMTFSPTYQNPDNINAMVECCKMADVITVTTAALRDVYLKFNPNVLVVPNALNDDLFGSMHDRIPENDNRVVGWRGSETHMMDLMLHADSINDVITRTAKKSVSIININTKKNMAHQLEWVFLGYKPFFINGIKHIPVADPLPYHENIRRINPKIMMVPLIDSAFNRCKSNINMIESFYAGAVPLVPRWPEWEHGNAAITYGDPAEFHTKLLAMVNGDFKLEPRVKEGWNWVWENRLSIVNEKRAEIIKNL